VVKKAEAVAFLNTVDSKVSSLDAAKKSRVGGKISALAKMDEITLTVNKEAVGYMLNFSGTKDCVA
jgi:hypothetical protein